MRHLADGKTPPEIAEAMGIQLATVYQHLVRAKQNNRCVTVQQALLVCGEYQAYRR